MDSLDILQAIRLKGRAAPADIAATLNRDEASVAAAISEFVDAGILVGGKAVRLAPAGRDRLGQLLADERGGVDTAAMSHIYKGFGNVNAEFKSLVSDWQLKDGEPNNHEDAEYDTAVLTRLDHVHESVLPIIASAAAQIPRLARYADKLSAALEKIRAGDTTWLTRPIMDSYHTVWFELHEELILAAGLTREAEAKAGTAE